MDIKETDKKYIANTYGRYGAVLEEGRGSVAFGDDGKRYIDLGGGIAVNTFGFCDKSWNEAVKAQLDKLAHTSNLYYSEPQALLAEALCQRTGMKKVFFSNSGAEANECAIKTARKYSFDKYGRGRDTVVTLKNSFHGRTVTTLSATGQDVFHNWFFPFTEGFAYAEAGDFEDTVAKAKNACAVMMELIQGEGGVYVLDRAYVSAVAKWCADNDVLLIIDEVQTGNGRTGKLYCYENYGIIPDIVTTAKGLAGGLPLGACLLGGKTEHTLSSGMHGSTFGGNPVCAAGALNVLSRIDGALLDGVIKREKLIRTRLAKCPGVKGISGMGLMLGIAVDGSAKDISCRALENGVLVLTAKDRLRLLPALNIPEDLLSEALGILADTINGGKQ